MMTREFRYRENNCESAYNSLSRKGESYYIMPQTTGSENKPTVLIVEDYPDAREMMRMMLDLLGYGVIEAENGAQAVEMAVQKHPDLILMDINLPVLDGFQASAQIRQQPGVAEVPIIACTAGNQWEWRKQALAVGCNDFMSKPLNFDELEVLLGRYLKVPKMSV